MYTDEEYKVYLKVKHALLLEDAKAHVEDWIANNDSYISDLNDEEYEDLIAEFEERVDYHDPTYNFWECVVNDYMEDSGYVSED